MLSFAGLEAKGVTIPNVVKKLYNDITAAESLDSITQKSGNTAENCKNALRFLTDVEAAVRQSQRVPPPPGGYKGLKVARNFLSPGAAVSSIGYTLSHNKRKIAVFVVGATVGVLTGGLGLVVLAAGTLGTYAAGSAWRRWGHIVLARKGSMDFDPNNAEDYADIEKHITTWQDRIVKRQMDGILQKMHFEQQCWDVVNRSPLFTNVNPPYRSCGEWVTALEAVCRLRKSAEEVHVGFKDVIHFWGLVTFEMTDRQEKFAGRISQILTAINTQIHKSNHTCRYTTGFFGDSTSRSISNGLCYEWKPPSASFLGGPVFSKHQINTNVMWELRLRTERTSLFMKLIQDASTWGNLIETAITGGSMALPGRFRSRLARSVDMFSGGKPDRAEEIAGLYPIFTKQGEAWALPGAAAPPATPTTTLQTSSVTPQSTTAGSVALTTATGIGTPALANVTGAIGSGVVSGTNIGTNIGTAFNPAATAAAPTNLFTNIVGSSASHAVNVGAAYGTAGLSVMLEILNSLENDSLVSKGTDLLGMDATVSELLTAHAGVLKDHFGAIATAWKGFRKADDALMNLGAIANCIDAFTAAANLLRRELYYRELLRLYQTLWTFVCLVGSTHGGIIQMMEIENPEIIHKLKAWLDEGHCSTVQGGAAADDVCAGYCYRPMTEALAVLHQITAPQTVLGAPVRPIGQQPVPRSATT